MKLAAVVCMAFWLMAGGARAQSADDVPAAAIDQWMVARMAEAGGGPPSGSYRIMAALTTGHMRRDPVHANAMRRVFSVWLNQSMAPGDTVQVAAAERRVWRLGEPVTLAAGDSRERVFSSLPTGPKPGSRGGKDLEAILADLAERASPAGGPVVLAVISNSWTQADDAPADVPSPEERLRRLGCTEVRRAVFSVPDGGYRRDVYVAGCTLSGKGGVAPATASVTRARFSPETWAPEAYRPMGTQGAPPAPPLLAQPQQGASLPPWAVALGIVMALAVGGGGVALVLRRPRPPVGPDEAPVAAVEPAQADTDARPAEVAHLLDDAAKHARVLRLLREGMTDSVDKLDALVASAQSGEEIGRLRTEVAGLNRQITDWDKSAIDYLDAVQAALSMPGLDESRRQAWKRAGDAFIRLAQRQGLAVIAPQPGEPYVEGLHKVTESLGDRRAATVIAVGVSWGYQNGSRLYRPAEVIATDPASLGVPEEQS